MKLDNDLLDFMKRALRTAQLMKFEDFVIEKEYVRGWNVSRTCIIADKNVPKLPFVGIGFNRVPKLIQRMAAMDEYTLDLETKNDFVMGVVIKGQGATMKFKCANPNAIKTPKHINDVNMWTMELSPTEIEKLTKAQSAMGATNIQLKSNDGACIIRLVDAERDTYEQEVLGHVMNIGGINDSRDFDKQYDAGTLLTVLKNCDKTKDIVGPEGSVKLTVGQGGNLAASINGIVINIVPMIQQKVIL